MSSLTAVWCCPLGTGGRTSCCQPYMSATTFARGKVGVASWSTRGVVIDRANSVRLTVVCETDMSVCLSVCPHQSTHQVILLSFL